MTMVGGDAAPDSPNAVEKIAIQVEILLSLGVVTWVSEVVTDLYGRMHAVDLPQYVWPVVGCDCEMMTNHEMAETWADLL